MDGAAHPLWLLVPDDATERRRRQLSVLLHDVTEHGKIQTNAGADALPELSAFQRIADRELR